MTVEFVSTPALSAVIGEQGAPTTGVDFSAPQECSALLGVQGGPGGLAIFFKMRALADPGPGFETWVVEGAPDFAGVDAGGPIQPGTAVQVSMWFA
jgi:hypothetical protein